MEALFEIIFGRIITQYLGLNVRYYFLKIFDKNLKKQDIVTSSKSLEQGFYNSFIGLIVFCLLLIVIAYMFYKLDLL
ncbi:hypothetical protein IW22_05905 [Chryseobacterium sp. JM1]|nr:hypothetical protein IW22_05905 [Chryseobacterium sp. JM1]